MNLLQLYDSLALELEEVRDVMEGELISDMPRVADLIAQVSKFRGKMLRPALVLLCGKAGGDINRKHHLVAAVAEMIHMAALIHDDVLDGGDRRRRGRTINAMHGNSQAVLLGDLFVSHAFHLLTSLDEPACGRMMAATTNTMCEGELMQLHYRKCFELTEEHYLEIISRKTASLIATCCYLGAKVSHATESICGKLEDFGRNLGIAFQIVDDVTDLTGDEQAEGKTLRRDLFQGKLTLPIIHYAANCHSDQTQWLRRTITEQRIDDYPELVTQLYRAGSIEYAHRRAADFIAKACACLNPLTAMHGLDVLEELASMVITPTGNDRLWPIDTRNVTTKH